MFQTDEFYIDAVVPEDRHTVLSVYASNKEFLLHHTGNAHVTDTWLQHELESMKAAGFYSCKIVEKRSGNVIGIADFQTGDETYLSLLMLHGAYQNKGLGKRVYRAIEEYAKLCGSAWIRIDVVTGYDNSALRFWQSQGFIKIQDIALHWAGRNLPAAMMKKKLI